jgi:hypothetical protein
LSLEVVTAGTARDIEAKVERILRDLGCPEPPLDLDQVRDLLSLDRSYYSSADDGILQEVVHRLTIGTKQVLKRPTRIIEAIKERSLRALWIPEQKRILIDDNLHEMQKRWGGCLSRVRRVFEGRRLRSGRC